jgi:hypothetical protein
LGLAPAALADSWKLEQSTTVHKFGHGIRFEYSINPIKGGDWANFEVRIKNGAVVLGRYSGIGYGELIASPGETLFVGLSNSGIPGTAVVVFDRDGDILLLAQHDVARFDYCDESITVVRTWHGSEKGDLQFADESVGGISLMDCRGKRVKLLDIVSEAHARGQKHYEDWKVGQESSKK